MSSQTYAGHASVCAAGLANIAILEREELIGGTGLMVSVAISPPHLAAR